MWPLSVLVLLALYINTNGSIDTEEPELYYYGLEESERSLPLCATRQACSALILRHWRAPALVRLCRCARRRHCDRRAPHDATLELNNRAKFQFCQPTTIWPRCSIREIPLTIDASYVHMNPDKLEEMHHKNIQLVPPKIVFNCRCPEPNYWKLNSSADSVKTLDYHCASLPHCQTGEFCGKVNYDLNALYQSCLCPKHHICVHNGGITNIYISELLYHGKGWNANCQRISDDDSYEDF